MSSDKIPPQNVDAEMSLLGAVLVDEDAMTAVSDIIVADDFYEDRNKTIYDHMVRLYDSHRPIDLLTVSDSLRKNKTLDAIGGTSYLTELANFVPSSANSRHYAEIISHKAVRRNMMKASSEIIELSYDESQSVEQLVEQAEKSIMQVSEANIKDDLVPIEAILASSFDRLDDLHKDSTKVRGVPTGFRDVDNTLSGFQKSDLIILAARPAMGKSTLAMNFAHNIAVQEKKAVLYFSLEMSKEQLVDRVIAAEAGIDAWKIRTGNLRDTDFDKIGHAMGVLSETPLFIDDTPGINPIQMRTKSRRIAHKHDVGLIVVDYLQLMSTSSGRNDGRVNEITEISLGLKALARELDVPVLALSQLSRSVESRTPPIPQLSDLRDSGSIEQDADIVMFMYRDEYYNPENTTKPHITDLLVKKHRNGPVGSVELFFDDKHLQFMTLDKQHSDMPEADIPAEFDN